MQKLRNLSILALMIGLSVIAAHASITVTVSPSMATVTTNGQQQFTATVSGTSNQIVTWSLSGSGCIGLGCGYISSTGLYTAPSLIPSPPTVTVIATSIVDGTEGTATVTIQAASQITVTISPTYVVLPVNGQQQFTATVTGTNNQVVTWSISGTGCYGSSCGTITSNGLYTAPPTVPNPSIATITATSVADPSKSASATVIIQLSGGIVVTVSPATAQVAVNAQQQFTATVSGTNNTQVTWSLSGAGCSGASCGTITANGLYTAPPTVPNPPTVTVTATSQADPSKYGSATVTVYSGPTVTVSPSMAQVQVGGQQQFTATVTGTNNTYVLWSVSGKGCIGISCGTVNSNGLYTAPSSVPVPPTVAVTATLLANPQISGSATVTITPVSTISVSVLPTSATLGTGAQQQFTATVSGTNNQAVTWSISGIGCYQNICGTIDQTGLYTAPPIVPNPSYLNVVATSQADPSKYATATVVVVAEVTVTISPTTATVTEGGQQQFTATVVGSQNRGVTWSVSGAGCSGAACGTVTSTGLYTAPNNLPIPPTVAVTATSQADPSKYASATVTITANIVVTVSPPTANVSAGDSQQFTATVTGTNNTQVTWSLQGAGCSGSSCGTIDQSGLYTAPLIIPSPPVVTVIATSQADPSSYGTATVTILPSGNAKLNGQYAFLLRGFDPLGTYEVAGSFKADGQGHITWGLEDVNATQGPWTSVSFTGSYHVGGDSRGTMQITSALGTFTYAFALNSTGNSGRLIAFDNTGIRGSGVIRLQDPTAFNNGALTGGYVFGLSGLDISGGRIAALGLVLPSGSGFVSGSSLDVNDNGNSYPTFGPFSGNYNIDVTGRGTMAFSLLGLGSGTLNFAIYVISANEFLLVTIDPLITNQFILAGSAEAQTGSPYSLGSFNGQSVFHMTAEGTLPMVTIGRFSWDGMGILSADFDRNNGGQVTIAGQYTGAYDMQLNGRGNLNMVDSNGHRVLWVMYALAPNRAFLMDDAGASAGLGELKPQIAPPFENSTLYGNFLFASEEPGDAATPLFSGTAYFDGSSSNHGMGNVTGMQDESTPLNPLPNQPVLGTYSVSSSSNNGRGTILLSSPAGTYALWVITNAEFVAIETDSSPSEPTVLHFQQ